jgi:hypothetical protein
VDGWGAPRRVLPESDQQLGRPVHRLVDSWTRSLAFAVPRRDGGDRLQDHPLPLSLHFGGVVDKVCLRGEVVGIVAVGAV